jgi:hypothetical protein
VLRTPDRGRLAAALALVVLMAGGAALRVHRADAAHGRVSADERAYLRLARDAADRGNWGDFGLKQPFRWAPVTPLVFAAGARISGRPVGRGVAFATQAVAGTLLIGATFALGMLLGGLPAAVAAATGVAFYPPLVWATGTAGTEVLGALAIVLAAIVLAWAWARGRPAAFALAGLVLGGATLVRGDLVAAAVLMPAVAGLAAGRARRRGRAGLAVAAAMLAGALVAMAPWSAFASAHAHRFVPVTDGGAANLFVGTYLPGDGTIFGVKHDFAAATRRVHPMVRRVPAFRLQENLVLDAVAAEHPRATREASLRAAASDNLRRYALGRPVAFAGMEARKLWRMWGGPYTGTLHRDAPATRWLHRALVALALAGLAAGLIRVRDRRLVLLAALLAITTLVDVAFVSEARHNVRLLPVLLAAGAAGWVRVAGRLRRAFRIRRQREGAGSWMTGADR